MRDSSPIYIVEREKKEISKDSEKLTWREEKSAARICGVHVEPTWGPTFADALLLQSVKPKNNYLWQVAVMEMDKALNLMSNTKVKNGWKIFV